MSPAIVAETTALFPPQQARLSLPRVPRPPPSSPRRGMSCGEKPFMNGTLPAAAPAADCGMNSGLSWYKWLPGRSRQPRLEPLRDGDSAPPVNYQIAPGQNGSDNKLHPARTPTAGKGEPHNKTRSKLSPKSKSKPDDWTKSKKENSETARRRPKARQSNGGKFPSKQRMSYPPCTGPVSRAEWEGLSAVKETNSCPVLWDLENLAITPKKPALLELPDQKGQQATEKTKSRLCVKHQHKPKQDTAKRHGEHDRLRVPDAGSIRPRQRRSRNGRDDQSRTHRPKPPSWQDLPSQQTAVSGAATQDPVVTHTFAVPESVNSYPGYRCDSATTRSTAESERRAVRANIRRTRSRVIDSKEIPKAETVLPLAQTKPSEFHLRKTYHDDTVYLLENAQRCHKWLAALEESDVTPHVARRSKASSRDSPDQDDGDETVTCDVEISPDKWNFLGSPYPTSSECSSDDP